MMKLWTFAGALSLAFGVGYLLSYMQRGQSNGQEQGNLSSTSLRNGGVEQIYVSTSDDTVGSAAMPDGATLELLQQAGAAESFDYFYRWIRSADVSEYAAIMEAINEFGGRFSTQLSHLLMHQWVELDPDGIHAYVLSLSNSEQVGISYSLFGAWAAVDPQSAYDGAMRMPVAVRQRSVQAVIYAIAGEQPLLALSMADENPEIGRGSSHVYRTIYERWAHKDVAGARAQALTVSDPTIRAAALRGVLREWTKTSPIEALGWIESMPQDYTVRNVRRNVFSRLFNENPEVAKSYIENKDSAYERRQLIRGLYFNDIGRSGDVTQIQQTFDWLETVATGRLFDQKVGDLMRAVAENDPDQAILFVQGLRAGNGRLNAVSRLANELAERSPEAAFAFVDSLEYEDEKVRALGNMGWQLARGDIPSTAQLILAHPDVQVQERIASQLVREWATFDREAALEWSEQLTSENAQRNARRSIVTTWLQKEPQSTFAYIESLPSEANRHNLYENAFNEWAREDPKAAVAGLADLPEGSSAKIDNIYGSIARSYIQHDPLAASEWIATIEPGSGRDNSVQALVSNIARTDPEAAFIWAETVDDTNTQLRALTQSVKAWAKQDASLATQAVKNAAISDDAREKLLGEIDRAAK